MDTNCVKCDGLVKKTGKVIYTWPGKYECKCVSCGAITFVEKKT